MGEDARSKTNAEGKLVRDHVRKMLTKLAVLEKQKRIGRQTSKSLRPEGIKINGEEDSS